MNGMTVCVKGNGGSPYPTSKEVSRDRGILFGEFLIGLSLDCDKTNTPPRVAVV